MFCRFCGKSIHDDSDFCAYCGSPLKAPPDRCVTPSKSFFAFLKSNTDTIIKYVCYLSLLTFLILNIKMAPWFGFAKFLAYIVEAAIAIFLTVISVRSLDNEKPHINKFAILSIALLVVISSIIVRLVYESKVYYVESNIPTNGTITVEIDSDTDYYSYVSSGLVYDPNTTIKINGESGKVPLTLGQECTLLISCTGNHNTNSKTRQISLNSSDFRNGCYTTSETIGLNGFSAEVTIKLRRVCTFWEVVFY